MLKTKTEPWITETPNRIYVMSNKKQPNTVWGGIRECREKHFFGIGMLRLLKFKDREKPFVTTGTRLSIVCNALKAIRANSV